MFVLCTTFEIEFFYFEHRAGILSRGKMAVMNKSPQIASNALNKEYNMRQDNILTS